jgi:ABC-2 type transport system ATP-binding protein
MPAVSVRGVSKKYRIFPNGRDRLKETLSFGRKRYGHDFWALQDINLEVEPGMTLGILGRNGAGKSTLLNIIAGIRQPTSGTVEVNGRLVALSGLGAGFNSEFTGRENIMMNGLILGIERQELLERFDDIAAFADIGEFIDQPIKTYSSGMRSRLGFAVAINVQPDVLILDETLAAGDAVSKEAALQKMYELRDSGTTILLVSHGMSTIEDFCTEAILLHEGRMLAAGGTNEVIGRYQELVSSIRTQRKGRTDDGQPQDQAAAPKEETPEGSTSKGEVIFKEDHLFERRVAHLRSGTGEARIRGVELLNKRLRPVEEVPSGSTVTVRVYLEYLEAVQDTKLIIALYQHEEPEQAESPFYGPNLGYVLDLYESYRENPESVDEGTREFFESWSPPRVETNGRTPTVAGELFSASTALKGIPLKEMKKGERVVVDFTFDVPLIRGLYSLTVGARAGNEDPHLDKIDSAMTFQINRPRRPRDQRRSGGLVRLPVKIKVHTPEGERQGRSA